MSTLRALQEQRETLVAAARERLDNINANTDESRTAELESQHDAAMTELDKLDAKIGREQRVENAERSLEERSQRELRERRPVVAVAGTRADGNEGAMTYRTAFHEYLRAGGQVGEMSDEARSVLRSGYQVIGDEQRAQVTGTTTAGGYAVPIELQAEIIRTMKMFGPMYDPGITREFVTTGGYQLPFPTVDDTANTFAGTTQGTTLLDDASGDVVFGQKALGAFSYSSPWVRVSKELADDSVLAMEALLGSLLGERLGRGANAKLTTGAGTTEPNGIVTAATGAGITAASTTAFTFDEVISLVHAVDPAYRSDPSVCYMFSDPVLQAARKLKDGQGNYLWQHGNVQQGVPSSLNGYNYHINQAMSQTFTTGQKLMAFGAFSKYFVRKVGAPLVGAIQDKDFWPGFGIAGWIRFDGNLMDTNAIKLLKLA